jgi:hypothetical protein
MVSTEFPTEFKHFRGCCVQARGRPAVEARNCLSLSFAGVVGFQGLGFRVLDFPVLALAAV